MIAAKGKKTVLSRLRAYVKLAASEPEVLRVIGVESKRRGTSALTSREIERVIRSVRSRRGKSTA